MCALDVWNIGLLFCWSLSRRIVRVERPGADGCRVRKLKWRWSVKVGDLVVCNCPNDTWYKGKVGMLLGFNLNGIPNEDGRGSAVVWYGHAGHAIHLMTSALKVMS